ncbi:MAG: hypothetical protein O7C67_01035 [Gammaproteobacteria bacterium]|nr:hypothetical protein [Gammaproteobacteria bacterium]
MDTTKIANWMQIFGNLGLLVGLILIALQINQATYLVRSQLVSDQYSDRMAARGAMMGENPADTFAKAVVEPEQLTDAELVVMDAWMTREISYWRRVKLLTDSGVYPPEVWQQHSTEVDYALASKFGRTWWTLSRPQYLQNDADFVSAIDAVMQALPEDDDWDDFFVKIKLALSE